MTTEQKKANIIQFQTRSRLEAEEELPVGLPPSSASQSAPAPIASAIDLTGKPKIWFAIGPGRSGKTMLLRWAAEVCVNQGATPIVAAADPQNRSLKNYMEVEEPPTNDATATSRWMEALLRHAMEQKASALVDLGGGDTSLHKLLATVPDLAAALEESGVATVALYTLGPRVDDLASLASFEALGFKPAATVLICNEGLADPTIDRDDAFARVRRHSAYRAAVARGAAETWMPRMDAAVAQEIEAKRLGFIQARDALSPAGRKVAPLGPFDRSRVRLWLHTMAAEMAPIMSWLP
ncbi:MAG: hypothetical protein ABSC06_12850 [Rhodopila sp.]|jgi:hypothetical protein